MKSYPKLIMYIGFFCVLMALVLTAMSIIPKLLCLGMFFIATAFIVNGVENDEK